jgi:GT2 family glycosyltransferase
MPYINRLEQLERTLISFAYHYGGRSDYEVIVVEDAKNDDNLRGLLHKYRRRVPLRHFVLDRTENVWTPTLHYNFGVEMAAHSRYVVLTNPECLHATDVLAGFDRYFNEAVRPAYIICTCKHVHKCQMPNGDYGELTYEDGNWLQHSQRNNRMLNFCAVMPRDLYLKVGGFDNEYATGYAYADDDFRDRVVMAVADVVLADDLLVLHQEHPRVVNMMPRDKYRPLLEQNRQLYYKKKNQRLQLASGSKW